jgi:hypothetical protein
MIPSMARSERYQLAKSVSAGDSIKIDPPGMKLEVTETIGPDNRGIVTLASTQYNHPKEGRGQNIMISVGHPDREDRILIEHITVEEAPDAALDDYQYGERLDSEEYVLASLSVI